MSLSRTVSEIWRVIGTELQTFPSYVYLAWRVGISSRSLASENSAVRPPMEQWKSVLGLRAMEASHAVKLEENVRTAGRPVINGTMKWSIPKPLAVYVLCHSRCPPLTLIIRSKQTNIGFINVRGGGCSIQMRDRNPRPLLSFSFTFRCLAEPLYWFRRDSDVGKYPEEPGKIAFQTMRTRKFMGFFFGGIVWTVLNAALNRTHAGRQWVA